jgi:hypothetical protein
MTFYSNNRGRSGRGRNYLTGFVEDDVDPVSVSNATLIQDAEAGYESLRDNVQQNTGYFWVIASKFSNGLPRAEIVGFDVATIEVRNARLGTQRRRVVRP